VAPPNLTRNYTRNTRSIEIHFLRRANSLNKGFVKVSPIRKTSLPLDRPGADKEKISQHNAMSAPKPDAEIDSKSSARTFPQNLANAFHSSEAARLLEQCRSDSQWFGGSPATVRHDLTKNASGMLGGFEHISRIDLQGSKNFFAKLKLDRSVTPLRVADCGAG
jgi:hypothetical protein